MRLESRSTLSGWLDSVPRLSASRNGDVTFRRVRAFNELGGVAALGTILLLGFTHLVLFLLDRRRTQNGWFFVQAMTAAMYPCFVLGYSQDLFGTVDASVFAVTQAINPVAALCFTRAAFKLGPPPRIYGVLLALVLVIALVAPGPFATTIVLAPAVIVLGHIAIAHHLVTLGGLARRRPRPKNTFVILAAWLFALVAVMVDAPAWLGLYEPFSGVRAGSWGLLVVGILQSIALSRDHIVSLNQADALNAELGLRVALLEDRQREIQVLNDELRRQITERSRHMSAAFTRLAAGSEASTDLAPGEIVDERYRVVRAVGAGGMGFVYEVVRVADLRRLALKVLKNVGDGMAVARFAREAQIASSIDHANVVSLVDVGVAPSGYVYLVMEFVEGVSLAVKRPRFGDAPWALELLRQIAEGLAAIHAAGVVHRDLKPSNVLLTEEASGPPRPKICDFGISSLASTEEPRPCSSPDADPPTLRLEGNDARLDPGLVSPLTLTGMVLGTPVYMAPELARGAKSAQSAADIFSLGVMAFEMLSGRRPFAEAPALTALRGLKKPPAPPPIATLVAGLSPEVAAWVDRALLSDPDERGSAHDLAAALARDPIAPPSPS